MIKVLDNTSSSQSKHNVLVVAEELVPGAAFRKFRSYLYINLMRIR